MRKNMWLHPNFILRMTRESLKRIPTAILMCESSPPVRWSPSGEAKKMRCISSISNEISQSWKELIGLSLTCRSKLEKAYKHICFWGSKQVEMQNLYEPLKKYIWTLKIDTGTLLRLLASKNLLTWGRPFSKKALRKENKVVLLAKEF